MLRRHLSFAMLLVTPAFLSGCGDSTGSGGAGDITGATGTTSAATGSGSKTASTTVDGATSTSTGTSGPSVSSAGSGLATPDECANPDPAWVFCSDFEEGNKDAWDDYDGNPDETNLLMEDAGPFALAQNHVMRMRVPEGRGGVDLVKELPPSDRLYARWYLYYEPGFDLDAPNHGAGLNGGDRNWLGRSDFRPQGNDYFGSWLEYKPENHRFQSYTYYRGMYQDCVDPEGQCWGDHFPCMESASYCSNPDHVPGTETPVIETGRWYCIEMMIDAGTPSATAEGAGGVLDYWIDGVEMGAWENLWLRTTESLKVDILWLSLFHHAEHSVEGVFYDNVVASTERIGCP